MSPTQSSISCVPFKWCAKETIVANKISFSNMTGFGSSCGACKFLRRKCTGECVFALYFSYDQASNHFAAVHKVFGASNVSKLLLNLPVQDRGEAAISVSYEALARMRDPIYGCVGHILVLQQQVASLQEEVDLLGSQMAKVAFDVPTYGTSQSADNNPNNGLQFGLQCNDISISDYLDQGNPSLSGAGSTTESYTFYNQTQEQFPQTYGLENQVSCSYSNSNFAEKLYQGMEDESFLNLPWMDSGCNTLNVNNVEASTFRSVFLSEHRL